MTVEDVELLSRIVLRLGGYAEGLLDYHPLGIPRPMLQNYITDVYETIRGLLPGRQTRGFPLRPPNIPAAAVWEDVGNSWNYLQTLRFAAGAMMLSQKYGRHMSKENLRKALFAKVLHKCQIGILDDLIDKGEYAYLEAKEIHHLVLSSMIDPHFNEHAFVKHLIDIIKQEQMPLFELVTQIAKHFNRLWNGSPHGTEYFYWMELLDERVALGQGLTMFQKEERLDLTQMARIASAFHAPTNEFAWWEKIAAHVSSSTRYNFIDMAFSEPSFDLRRLESFLTGWYYYDTAIILMDHAVSVYPDLRNGIANFSLIAMREKELLERTTLRGYDPQLTVDDYEDHLSRLAYLARRGLELVRRDFPEESKYYAFITVMMPVVMMADWIGNRDDMIHHYMEEIAPATRDAMAGVPGYEEIIPAKVLSD
ncbi:MAG: hypothetical protein HY557_03125 [Euryarchaeota archaeon]|nr:hypothetical protein [Euryarchaeota archaeon]